MPAALAVFVLAFVVYAFGASPVPGWLDSSELVAASACLGVAHPPGHPLAVLVGYAASLVPVGDIAFRVTLASAAAVGGAAAATTWATARVATWVDADGPALRHQVVAGMVGLTFATSSAAGLQAVRTEVYGLEIALCAVALAFLLEPRRERAGRATLVAALVLGLGLANHHFMTILFLVPAAGFALARRPSLRIAGWAVATGGLGLLAYGLLPLRAARDPVVNWGNPDDLGRLLWTVSAKAFSKSLGPDAHGQPFAADLGQVAAVLVEELAVIGALVVLAGAYVWIRRGRGRAVLGLLAAVIVLSAAGRAALGFDFDNPDARGYLLPAVMALGVVAGGGVLAIAAALGLGRAGRTSWPPIGLLGALVPAQLVVHDGVASRRNARASDDYARAVFENAPPRALVVTTYFETAFQVWALRTVEASRPDVAHLDMGFATHPGYAEAERRRTPELAPLVDAGLRLEHAIPFVALDTVAAGRPVLFELAAVFPEALERRLTVVGPLARYGAGETLAKATDLGAEARTQALAARLLAGEDAEPGSRRVAIWLFYLAATHHCHRDDPIAAAPAYRSALAIAPDDALLAELGAACKIPLPVP